MGWQQRSDTHRFELYTRMMNDVQCVRVEGWRDGGGVLEGGGVSAVLMLCGVLVFESRN